MVEEDFYVSRNGIRTENSYILKVHNATNYEFADFKRERGQNSRNSDVKQDGRRGCSTDANGVV